MDFIKKISKPEALKMMLDDETIIIDIRDEDSYEKGHISRAIHMDNAKFPLFTHETPKNKNIIVVCYHGNSSQGIAQYLTIQGFSNVYSLIGGYEEWHLTNE